METPIKISQFNSVTSLPSGSFLAGIVPSGSVYQNVKVSLDDITNEILTQVVDEVLTEFIASRYKAVPTTMADPGNDGDEAIDADHYYIHVGGVWKRTTLESWI